MLDSCFTSGLVDGSFSSFGGPCADDSISHSPLNVDYIENSLAERRPDDDEDPDLFSVVEVHRVRVGEDGMDFKP
jgi:hypothetical protein